MALLPVLDNFSDLPAQAPVFVWRAGERADFLRRFLELERPGSTVEVLPDGLGQEGHGQNGYGLAGLPAGSVVLTREERWPEGYFAPGAPNGSNGAHGSGPSDLPDLRRASDAVLRAGRVLHGLSAPGAPLFDRFQMEITTACSMACAFCGHAVSERGARPMDFELFREAVACVAREELAPAILFSGLGEPLLSPRLEEAVSWCKSQGLSARIITNGLGLTAERHEALLAAGVDRLMVSLHNLTPEAFALRGARDGTDYQSFRARALACVDRHLARREPSELILFLMSADPGRLSSRVWDFPALDREAAMLPRLVREFWDELAAIGRGHGQELRVGLDAALDAFAGLDNHGDRGHLQVFERVAVSIFPLFLQPEAVMRALRPRALNGWSFAGRERGGCVYMEGPQVLAGGEVIPCCGVPTFESELSALSLGRFEPGNPEASLSALLAGPRYRALYRGFWEGRAAWGFCRRCLALQDMSQRFVDQGRDA